MVNIAKTKQQLSPSRSPVLKHQLLSYLKHLNFQKNSDLTLSSPPLFSLFQQCQHVKALPLLRCLRNEADEQDFLKNQGDVKQDRKEECFH